MDAGRDLDTSVDDKPLDNYLLQFWPASPAPDRVVRQSSLIAEYWHTVARQLPPPPTPEERAEAERLAREAKERAAEEWRLHREAWQWGGRPPSEELRTLGAHTWSLLRFDPGLVHTLGAAGAGTRRGVALLAARRACETAGLTEVPWVAEALTAAEEGAPLPSPFHDSTLLWETFRSDPRVPRRSVPGAVPPERPPYEPPASPAGPGGRWVPAEEPDAPGKREPSESSPVAGSARQGLGKYLGALVPPQPPSADRVTTPPSETPPSDMPQSGTLIPPAPGAGYALGVLKVADSTPDRPRDRISQPHFALPAVPAAVHPDLLRAALDAVSAAVETYGERYPELLAEIRAFCAAEDEPGERP
jgi:hypothetical protein